MLTTKQAAIPSKNWPSMAKKKELEINVLVKVPVNVIKTVININFLSPKAVERGNTKTAAKMFPTKNMDEDIRTVDSTMP